jgi:hypothetical protein
MKQKQQDPVADGKWVVELWDENERSIHGHTVLAITGPMDGGKHWTQTYDFLGGERYTGGATSVEYTPLEEKDGKQRVDLSGFDEGRGFPDVVLSSRDGVGYRQIGSMEAITGRRVSTGPSGFNYQVPGFVRYRAPMGHEGGPMLYGTAVSLQRWTVEPQVGQKLQELVGESAKNPPPYAAMCSPQDFRDPNTRSAETCHSWAKDMVGKVSLQVSFSVAGPAPETKLNYFCYTCGLAMLGGMLYLIGRLGK